MSNNTQGYDTEATYAPEMFDLLKNAYEHLKWYHGRYPNNVCEEEDDLMDSISSLIEKIKSK